MESEKIVFISYSSKEMETAVRVCNYLEEQGIVCWIAPRNIEAGANYASQIVAAIRKCDTLVMLASESTNVSGHVSNEVSIAFDNKKNIIPFKLQDIEFTDEYLYFLGRKHWIEAHQDFNKGLLTLKDTICSLRNKETGSIITKQERPEQNPVQDRKQDTDTVVSPCYSREAIVQLIIEKSQKYPYNIYKRLTDRSYEAMLDCAEELFDATIHVYRQGRMVECSKELPELIVEELSGEKESCIQVQGLPGSAKNMLLQFAFYKMLKNFSMGVSNALPFYVSASYYEKLPYNQENVAEQMKAILAEEFQEYFEYLQEHPEVRPVLFVEAIREHNVAKISPENVMFELWRKYGKFSRICAIDVGLIKNRARLKRVIPIAGDNKGYLFSTHQVPTDDRETVIKMIRSIYGIYQYELDVEETYLVLKRLKFPVVDIFLIRLIATEMQTAYDYREIRLSDMYEKLALSELYGDVEKLKRVASELYHYVFDVSYNLNTIEYNGAMWSLPHKHSTYLEFLIAYYFVDKVEHYQEQDDYAFLKTIMTAMSNRFVVSFLQDNYPLQEILLDFIKGKYDTFDVRQKSNAAYWLGRLEYKNLSDAAVEILQNEFERYKDTAKKDNRNCLENCDRQFLFRSICTGLMSQGQVGILDEYLCVVIVNDIANAINRGAVIEYFGDNYQMAAHDAYYMDKDINLGEQAIRILNSRIESVLLRESGRYIEKDLVTMLSLLQARIQNKRKALKYDLRPLAEKALEYLSAYQTRPKNVVSDKLQFYFKSMEEDLRIYLDSENFDIGPLIYNRYRGLREIKRNQWLEKQIEDPESIAEHTFSAWIMAMFFLPEEYPADGYSKREILDMLLVHDMAEADVGDQMISLNEPKRELKKQNDVLKKLFVKGTYPDIANLTHYYNVWTGYYNGMNVNARIARDINLLQTVYTFCEYYCRYPEHFESADVEKWMKEKNNLKTELGYELFDRLITNNQDFMEVVCLSGKQE